jgi:hypothetical protein
MCCHKPRRRSENRIFGNCVFPENGAYQAASGFIFFGRFLLLQKPSIGSSEVFFGIPLRPNSPLGQGHQRATDREMTLPGDATHFDSQWSRDTNALTNSLIFWPFEGRGCGFSWGGHVPIVNAAHHCGSHFPEFAYLIDIPLHIMAMGGFKGGFFLPDLLWIGQ